MLNRIIFLLCLVSVIAMNSCKDKVNEINYNPNVLAAKDFVLAEDAVFEIVNAFFKGVHDTAVINSGFGYIDACGVSYYPDGDSLIYSYGDVDRLCQDNKFRRGLFRSHFNGDIFNEGVTANIITDSLVVDDLPVDVSMMIENLGPNSDNFIEYSVKVTSSLFILPDTNKIYGINLLTDYILVWEEGAPTPDIHEDDIYMVSGTASGLSSDLYEFSVIIQDPLTNYLDCYWIERGLSQITVPVGDYPTGTIDYLMEDGCNNEFNFNFNDNLFYHMIK